MIKDITEFKTPDEGLERLSQLATYRDAAEDERFFQIWTKDCQAVAKAGGWV